MGMAVSMAVPLIQSGDMHAIGVGGTERNPCCRTFQRSPSKVFLWPSMHRAGAS